MLSQNIAISPGEISIRYRLINNSERDITVLASFPLPEVRLEGPDETVSVPSDDPVNLLNFTTVVNGNRYRPAWSSGRRRRSRPHADAAQPRIPLAPHLVTTQEVLDRLPPQKLDELRRFGLAQVEEYDTGGGMTKHLAPRWVLQTTFFWEQTFPAKAETVIEHRYNRASAALIRRCSVLRMRRRSPGTTNTRTSIALATSFSRRSNAPARPPTAGSARRFRAAHRLSLQDVGQWIGEPDQGISSHRR